MARIAVRDAIRKKILRPSNNCEICFYDREMIAGIIDENTDLFSNDTRKKHIIVAHHYNYFRPLDVWWLCSFCHKKLHVLQKKHKLMCIELEMARQLVFNAGIKKAKEAEEKPNFEEEVFY